MQGDSTCSFPRCLKSRRTKGLCVGHYSQQMFGKELRPLRKKITAPCSFPNCERPHLAKGLCAAHRRQQRLGLELHPIVFQRPKGSPPIIRYDEVPCSEWGLAQGLTTPCHIAHFRPQTGGYSQVSVNGRHTLVHRYVWERDVGPIPEGMEIDHKCRVRRCCNVDHLRVATSKMNNTENVVGNGWQVLVARIHCPQGHPYDDENTYRHGTRRHCKECRRKKCMERYYRLKGATQL